jgi:DNA-binding response OmpR family regulator
MAGKILVVDDERNIGELIQLALKVKGYQVQYSTSGAGGVELFNQFRPDIALVDLLMPDMDGVEVARQIKRTDHGRDMPILLMTGRVVGENELDRSLFTGILEKPFNMATLGSTIEKFIRK